MRCDCALDGSAAGRPTVSQLPVTRGTTFCFCACASACCCVSACARRCRARMRAACVSSVLCTRVLVCKAQGSECGRGMRGEARCATCLFTLSPFLPAGEMAYILQYFCPEGKKPAAPSIFAPRVVSLARLAAQSLCRTQQSGVSRCLPAVQPPPSSRLQTWAKTHTFVCLYISNNKPCEWLQSNL